MFSNLFVYTPVYSCDALLTIIYHLGIIYNFKFNRNTTRVDVGVHPLGYRSRLRSAGLSTDMTEVS